MFVQNVALYFSTMQIMELLGVILCIYCFFKINKMGQF